MQVLSTGTGGFSARVGAEFMETVVGDDYTSHDLCRVFNIWSSISLKVPSVLVDKVLYTNCATRSVLRGITKSMIRLELS